MIAAQLGEIDLNPLFSRMTRKYTPPMNKRVMEGLAVSAMEQIEAYLDAQIRSVCIGMPSCVRYVRLERCTSQEEYEEITKPRNNRRFFDLADSSIYLVKLYIEFTDSDGVIHEIVRNLQLPFVVRGGILTIAGTKCHVTPVLSDKIFTPGNNSIFVRLMQDRNNVFRMYHTLLINGKGETRYVIWATLLRNSVTGGRALRAKTVITHYLLAKYGFKETFMRYAGVVPEYGDHISEKSHPPEDWMVYESTGLMPSTYPGKVYQKSSIKLAIRRDQWSREVETLIYGFFYIVDHFPSRFKPLESYLEDKSLWIILIGLILIGSEYGENKLHLFISENLETIDPYLDPASQAKLRERGINLENYHDLLNYLQVNFDTMIRENETNGLSVYGKNLEVLYYILYETLYGFAMVKFKLNKAINRRPLTLKDVTENLRSYVRMGAVYDLSSGKIITEAVNYGGDHLYPKLTAVVSEQENRSGAQKGGTEHIAPGPQHWLDLSMVTTGSVLNIPKSNPTPMVRINPWITLDEETNTILPNPKYEKLIEENKHLFKL